MRVKVDGFKDLKWTVHRMETGLSIHYWVVSKVDGFQIFFSPSTFMQKYRSGSTLRSFYLRTVQFYVWPSFFSRLNRPFQPSLTSHFDHRLSWRFKLNCRKAQNWTVLCDQTGRPKWSNLKIVIQFSKSMRTGVKRKSMSISSFLSTWIT